MKRDIDLARQLLLDIENRGADCSVSVLRTGPNHDADERIRYHLRLLIDAGMLKEVDRTASGVPCIRLTHEGHELLELSRNESRWREAKWLCKRRTGGLSLATIQSILCRLATNWTRGPIPQPTYGRRRRGYVPLDAYGPRAYRAYYSEGSEDDLSDVRLPYRLSPYRHSPYRLEPFHPHGYVDGYDWMGGHDAYLRVRPEYRARWRDHETEMNGAHAPEFDAVVPDYLI